MTVQEIDGVWYVSKVVLDYTGNSDVYTTPVHLATAWQ